MPVCTITINSRFTADLNSFARVETYKHQIFKLQSSRNIRKIWHVQKLTRSPDELIVMLNPADSPMAIFRWKPAFTSSTTSTRVSTSWAHVEYAYLRPVDTNDYSRQTQERDVLEWLHLCNKHAESNLVSTRMSEITGAALTALQLFPVMRKAKIVGTDAARQKDTVAPGKWRVA